ncbi:MAG: Rpn family recombination-promoting nuclease/putative transposase [Candidatus Adiutrix sp.]|jgi:predicted transposase/invertase (TIGR01784 family)|nr:Rpn family recombination-promoting nuclease/putative transposase [Candidatus Adiutrix sp.]
MSFALPKILPPYDDQIFKSILTRPEAELARVDLLSALLDRTVRSAAVVNVEPPKRDINAKNERFDVSCLFDDGDQAAVEMQADPMEGDNSANEHQNIRDRSLYGLADLHANQTGKGKDYSDIRKSYQITICNYRVFRYEHKLVETFKMRNAGGMVLSEAIASVFVDLTLVSGILKKSVDDMNPAEMWAVFLARADAPQCADIIDQIIVRKEGINVANTMLTTISQDVRERALFHSRKMAAQDAEHDKRVAEKRLLKLQDDLANAEKNTAITIANIAKQLLSLGVLTHEQIATATGLTLAEIERIHNSPL